MRVLLVDLDLRYPSIARMLAGRGRVLEDAGRQIGPYPVAMAPVGEQATMHVLTPFPMGTADAELLFRSNVFQDTLSAARMSYDLVLIDTGPIMAVPDAIKIAELCDAIVLTAELGRSTDAVMQEVLRRLNLTRKPICGVIVTKIDGSDRQAGTYSGYTDHRAPPGRAMIEHSAA
jgi:Mrp family chromosome partitioning ATPase